MNSNIDLGILKSGYKNNFPENNCCECGKDRYIDFREPVSIIE